jgi:predicted nucleotidyltransferase
LKFVCESAFSESEIEIDFYGSRVIGLATKESDIDIYVNVKSLCMSDVMIKQNDHKFTTLTSSLRASVDWEIKELIQETPIPVIVCVFVPMQLKCKFS